MNIKCLKLRMWKETWGGERKKWDILPPLHSRANMKQDLEFVFLSMLGAKYLTLCKCFSLNIFINILYVFFIQYGPCSELATYTGSKQKQTHK